MDTVRVIAPGGLTLRGPMKLGLTAAQHAPRAHVLGAAAKGGVYTLDGGAEVNFKAGEVIAVEGMAKLYGPAVEAVKATKS